MADADQQATAVTEWDEKGNPVKPQAATPPAGVTEWDEKGNPIQAKARSTEAEALKFRPNATEQARQVSVSPLTNAIYGTPEARSEEKEMLDTGDILGLSTMLGRGSRQLEQKRNQAELAQVKTGAPGYVAYTPGAGYDLAARAARMGSGLTSPQSLLQGAGLMAAPEVMAPYMIGEGLYHGGKATPKAIQGNPEAAEEALGGYSEAALGGAGTLGSVPSYRAAARPIGKALGERSLAKSTAEIKEAAPPGRHEIDYENQLERARPYLAEEQRTQPVTGVREAYEASNNAIQTIESKIGGYIDQLPETERVNAQDILDRAAAKLNDPSSPRTPAERAAGLRALEGFLTDEVPAVEEGGQPTRVPKDLTVKEADRLRWRFNRDMDSEMGMTEADRADVRASNPAFAAKEAAAEALRDAVYQKLEDAGIPNARELRGDEGAVIQMRDAFRRNINRAEKSNAPSAARRLGVFGPIGLGFLGETFARHLGLPPGVATATGLGSAALFEWYRNRMRPNPLVERGMGRLGESELAPNYPVMPPQPATRPIAGALPAPATAAGYPNVDTSGAVRGGRYTTPRGLVGEEPPIEAEFIPRRVPVQPERAGIGRMLPERTTPESTIPPDVEEPFRKEGTGTVQDERTLAGRKGIRQPVRGLLRETAGQTPPKEPIGRPLAVNPEATTVGRKSKTTKVTEAPKPTAKLEKLEAGKTPAYVAAAAKEAGAMPAGYQPGDHPGMGFFQFHDPELGGSFYIREGQVSARAIKEAMEARKGKIEPSPLVEQKTENVKREMARREESEPQTKQKNVQEEFSPEQLEDAELAIRSELDMRRSADRPGRYPIIESREGNTNPNWQEIVGWRGVGGMKGLQWTQGFSPMQIELALRRKSGNVYDTLIRRAVRSPEEVENATSFNPEVLPPPSVGEWIGNQIAGRPAGETPRLEGPQGPFERIQFHKENVRNLQDRMAEERQAGDDESAEQTQRELNDELEFLRHAESGVQTQEGVSRSTLAAPEMESEIEAARRGAPGVNPVMRSIRRKFQKRAKQ